MVFPTPVSPTNSRDSSLTSAMATASSNTAVCRVRENTEWRGGLARARGAKASCTRPIWRPYSAWARLGLCLVVKYSASSLSMLRVKAISWLGGKGAGEGMLILKRTKILLYVLPLHWSLNSCTLQVYTFKGILIVMC